MRLTDLYRTGRDVRFSAGEGKPEIVVWLQKLQPFEQEICITRAQGERAKIWAIKNLPEDHPDKLVYAMEVDEEFNREQMINIVASDELQKALASAEAYVSMDDPENNEWCKDEYLNSLREAWQNGARDNLDNGDDPEAQKEAQRVFEELKRFNKEVEKEFDSRRTEILRDYERLTDVQLRDKTIEKVIEVRADMRWMHEYERSEIWLATRDFRDHLKPYFESRAEVDQLHRSVLKTLIDAYKEIYVSPDEGKD